MCIKPVVTIILGCMQLAAYYQVKNSGYSHSCTCYIEQHEVEFSKQFVLQVQAKEHINLYSNRYRVHRVYLEWHILHIQGTSISKLENLPEG